MKNVLAIIISIPILFLSCEPHNENDLKSSSGDTASNALAKDAEKLLKTAGISIKVPDAQKGAKEVSRIATELNGIITHQSINSNETGSKELKLSNDSVLVISTYQPTVSITAKIPAEKLSEFIYMISEQSDFTFRSDIDIEDKSLIYLSNQMKAKVRQRMLSGDTLKKSKALTVNQAIGISDEAINQQIQERQINADVAYSKVELSLIQNPFVKREKLANTVLDDYQLPFTRRSSNALKTGSELFLSFILLLAHFWIFLLLAITGWLFFMYYLTVKKPG